MTFSPEQLPLNFEEYKLALDLIEKESERFWTRNNVFLIIQGALIAFYNSVFSTGNFYGLIVAAQGFFLAVIWIGVLIKGKNYVDRWDITARDIEKRLLDTYPNTLLGLKRLNDRAKSNERQHFIQLLNKSTTLLIRYVIYSFMLFWSALFISLLISMIQNL